MTSVSDDFVFLEAEARSIDGTRLLSRGIGLFVHGTEALVALDASGERHLLIPLPGPEIAPDHASQGVALGLRILRVGGVNVPYADVHCRIPRLDLVFERLVSDIVARLATDSSRPVDTCRQVLDEWRSLLRAAGQDLARETIIGLVGELEVLRLLARTNASGALLAWRGPTRSVHDFVHGGQELEVKTTASVDGNFVSISNLAQLDPALVDQLHLVVVHMRSDEAAPSLDERIDALINMGIPRDALLGKIADTGYVYESGVSSQDRFRLISVRGWHVGGAFPGLRASAIGEERLKGVGKVRYELALDAAPKRLSDDAFGSFIDEWLAAR